LLPVFAFIACTSGTAVHEGAGVTVNPIRRVVTMLQQMQKKVEAEGKRDEDMYEKFMCYCKNGVAPLEESVSEAENKIPQLQASIDENVALLKQLKAELKTHKRFRTEATDAVEKATALREKEAAAFAKSSSEDKTNLDAVTKAIAALEKGMGSFLQTAAAATLRKLTVEVDINNGDRDILASFLAEKNGEGYEPQSGQIVGILKAMKDSMAKDFAEAQAEEDAAISNFNSMLEAKNKEIDANNIAIQEKLDRQGETGMTIQTLKEDLSDTKNRLKDDSKFLADLKKNCATRAQEWEETKKTRQEELLALADTIKMLNDDDALELFKKTLPSPSLLQMKVAGKQMREHALELLQVARKKYARQDATLDFIALAVRGRKVSFDKIISMIDEMLALLSKEQREDDEQKEYCNAQLDEKEDGLKVIEQTVSDLKKWLANARTIIANTADEVSALEKGIAKLDEEVTEATENRKEEHAAFQEDLANNKAAKDLLAVAKNRLYKFYDPKLYKEPAGSQVAEAAAVLMQVSAHTTSDETASPAPEVKEYKKKNIEKSGVVEMMDMLATDLDKEIEALKVEEKSAQREYEQFIEDSATKRTADTKAIAQKWEAKADAEASFTKKEEEHSSKLKEAYATTMVLKDLHNECDFLLTNYDVRKEARAGEIDALEKAKQVLNGADYSLVQASHKHHALASP